MGKNTIMSYQNKNTGEIISDQEYQSRFGSGTVPGPSGMTPGVSKPSSGSFLQRLKLGFGGREAIQQQHDIESTAGLRGKLDVGDIADVAGASLPILGGFLGGAGGPAGIAAGAALGQGARRIFGGLTGADQPTGGEIAKDVGITGVETYLGAKTLGYLFKASTKIIPQKLMSTIFKQSADDIMIGVRSQGKNLTQTEEVLKEGFRGSPEKMMTDAWNTMKSLEAQSKILVTGKSVDIPNKKGYVDLISNYLANLKSTSYGFETKIQQDGQNILNALKQAKGKTIPGEVVLSARRFIDGVRRASSFKLNPNLAPKEAAYKKAADVLRGVLGEQIEGLSPVMNRYSIHINAFEDLAKYAAKTQNKDIFDLLDVFIMYGIDPTAYFARRGLTSASMKTNVAQGLNRLGNVAQRFIPPGVIPTAATQGVRSIFNRQ